MFQTSIIPLFIACLSVEGVSAAVVGCSPPEQSVPLRQYLAPAPIEPAVVAAPGATDLPVCDPDWSEQIVSMAGHRRSPVVSAWLRNGIRVHHLRLDSAPGYVFVTVSFCGGELLETSEDRGVSLGACSAWDELSVDGMPVARPTSALEGRDVHVDGVAGPDSIQLRVWGRREDIDEGMRVAATLFERPKVTESTLAATMEQGWEQISRRAATSQGVIGDAITSVIFPTDQARVRTATEAELNAVTVAAAQECLDRHLAHAPMEVSIIGDLSLDESMRLAAGYLGRMPARDRVCAKRMAASRELPLPHYPIRARVSGRIAPGSTIVVVGFPGSDASDIPELRALRVAGRVLDLRATESLSEAGFADADVNATLVPGTVYPGFGLVIVSFATTPDQASRAGDLLEAAVRDLASTGVSAAEVKTVTDELARSVERFEREPRYWAGILARADSSGVDPDQVADGAAYYRGLNPDVVNAAVRRKLGYGRLLRLEIVSDGTVPPERAPATQTVLPRGSSGK